MKFGITFPQVDASLDPPEVRSFAQLAESLEYERLLTFDRVLGADPSIDGWEGSYDVRDTFHEALVLLGHLAAVTDSLRLMTGILVLPQRQTALVAKQTAEIDVLSEGRLCLGVGVGWNELEYDALGADFSTRGPRIEEQIRLLRRLWQENSVAFDGEYHRIQPSGLNPLPVQQPIPVWIGGSSDRVLRRIAQMGDGWVTPRAPLPELREMAGRLRTFLREEGRDVDDVAVLGRVNLGTEDPMGVDSAGEWLPAVREWKDIGATHLVVETIGAGYETPGEHRDAMRDFRAAVDASELKWE